jgi:hypothetical protein
MSTNTPQERKLWIAIDDLRLRLEEVENKIDTTRAVIKYLVNK